MDKYDTSKIRNLAIVGAKGVGKTTFVEAALFSAKLTTRIGRVDEGNSIIDYDTIEIERRQSILSKVVSLEWNGTKINLIDTPGYADFIGEVIGGVYASDVVLILVDSVNGVDIPTKRIFSYISKMGKPYAFFINKMDAERADETKTLASIKEICPNAALFHIPCGAGSSFKGVFDLLNPEIKIPADMSEKAADFKIALMEAVAESDEKLLEKYLESSSLPEKEMETVLPQGIAKGEIHPVFVGSSINGLGFDVFLNAVVKDMPSSLQMPPFKIFRHDKTELELKRDPKEPLAAHFFKTTSDPGIGDIFFFRVFSGVVKSGEDVYNSTKSITERMGHLVVTRGKERFEIDEIYAGDIAAVAKLKSTSINDTISSKNSALVFDPIDFPKPVVPMALKPKTKKDQDKMGVALSKLISVDPTLTYHVDKEFSETIITAMGEVQIEIMVKRLKERYGVEAELAKPHIPYREKITKKAEKQGKHKKQTGGHGQYGDCWLRLEPQAPGTGFHFANEIFGGSIPSKYVPAVEKGVREAMQRGTLAGYPVVDLKVTVFDGSYHDVDSSDISFQLAAISAFKTAMQEAAPQLLEPVVDLEVYSPQECMGDLSSDISSRRGRVAGMDSGIIRAKVPLAELYQYSAALKSITKGVGSYSIHFSHYEAVPSHIAQRIIEEAKREREASKT